jgi:hypothetical protein
VGLAKDTKPTGDEKLIELIQLYNAKLNAIEADCKLRGMDAVDEAEKKK